MSSLLMLVPLFLVLGLGLIFLFIGARWTHKRRTPSGTDPGFFPLRRPSYGSLEPPCRWLAVKGTNLLLVQEALGLHDTSPCSWEEGMQELKDQRVFISPPAAGWILVIGAVLPDPADDVDRTFHFLTRLSGQLGHIQFFSVNRVLDHHAWAIVDQGDVFRAYAWAGETSWNQGAMTSAEKELSLRCLDYGALPRSFSGREPAVTNSEKIYRLAARWSVDPTILTERFWNARRGIVGNLSQSKPH